MKIHMICLGCSKNLVDSEILAGMLNIKKFELTDKIDNSDVVILNTCGFIGQARKEAKQYINRILNYKKQHNFKFFVIGCLSQLEKDKLLKVYPGIDGIFGISDYHKIPKMLSKIKNFKSKNIIEISQKQNFLPSCNIPRILCTPKSYAYIKIADGCNNRCAYCLIPTIRGPYRERPIEDIIKEAQQIISTGRKEIILISNDTTLYGIKLYGGPRLHELIAKLSKIEGVYWIRLLYCHPAHFYPELIKEIAFNEKVCKYVDIPIQHTSDRILSEMGRKITRKQIFGLVEKLRKLVKNITIRTTLIVGFPTETEKDFNLLLKDIKQLEFDWLGCFIFSLQKGTKAAKLKPLVPKEVKKQRFDEIMKLQQKITFSKNQSRIGKTFELLIDENNVGHTGFQCPEVDGKTYITSVVDSTQLIVKIKVQDVVNIYDLSAQLC